MRILIVEDYPDAAASLALMLRLLGHQAEVAGDGDGAERAVRDTAPDVLILDIGLPRQDGYEVARRLRELLERRPLVIALTGYGREEDYRRSLQEGFDHHLVKPADPDLLQEILERFASRRANPAGS